MKSLLELTESEIAQLPLDQLGMLVLLRFSETNEWNTYNFLGHFSSDRGASDSQLPVAEAINWLIAKGLLARHTPGQNSDQSAFITRAGHEAMAEGTDKLRASERLGLDLHPSLSRIHAQFLLGEFELAAFAAMREVEIRVRQLARAESSLLGVKLMREALSIGGPLADPALDRGEQVGVMELFAGAIGTFKNPPSHRQVDYADPTEASEVVMLADLLMRLLERMASRLDQ